MTRVISVRRLNRLREAVRDYREGVGEAFEKSEVLHIADAKWAVDAYMGRPRLTVKWTTPHGERSSMAYGRSDFLVSLRDCGEIDMGWIEKRVKDQYDKYTRARLMDDIHTIRLHLDKGCGGA